MTPHLCWRPEGVSQVINPEAEAVDPAIFNAIHSPFELRVGRPVGKRFQDLTPQHYTAMSQEELLEAFMRPGVAYSRLAVFGDAGSGKSHLIHWLKFQLPSNAERLVLTVPKAGTSLRAIIEMIVSQLPAEKQSTFREILDRNGDTTATREGQKARLLNEIAYAIQQAKPAEDSPDPDLEQALIEDLPYLFQDVYFRERHFYRDDNIIADLVDHVFAAPSAYRPVEDRRRFTIDDFPIDPRNFAEAAQLAQKALGFLYSLPEAPGLAVDIVNRCLNDAIGRALSFTGDRLISLMADLRTHLRDEGRELVLLIEDFARLQGLDRALLQAMIDQGPNDDKLCRLRWAIAVTRGFFEQVVETVYMRMTLFVDMDRSAGRQAGRPIGPNEVAEFAGPYLNAARVGSDQLIQDHARKGGGPPLNACSTCGLSTACHDAFGVTTAGYGLYPFTRTALWIMAERADEATAETFNPRTLQTNVLRPVLDDHAPALAQGHFPPAALLTELGGDRSLGTEARTTLRRKAGDDFPRWNALLELWDGSGKIVNMPAPVLEAFGARPLAEVADQDVSEQDEVEDTAPLPNPTRSKEEDEIEAWARGGPLKEKLADVLRRALFPAISDSIDWDDLGLERTTFCGVESPRPFRRTSLTFTRQETSPSSLPVMLEIPGAGVGQEIFDKTALALKGLLKAQAHKGWDFAGGTAALATYLDCLALWRAEVIDQLRRLVAPREGWDPASASIELLTIGAVLCGRIKAEADLKTDVGALLAKTWRPEIAAIHPDLKKLYAALLLQGETLRDFVAATCSTGKGGEVGTLIDPSLHLETLRRFRADGWRLEQNPPTDERFDSLRRIADLYRRAAAALGGAAAAERHERLAWGERIDAAFGPSPKRPEVVEALNALRQEVVAGGLSVSAAPSLAAALQAFDHRHFDETYAAVATLREAVDALAGLPLYARGRQEAFDAGGDLIAVTERFLQQAASALQEQTARQTAQESEALGDLRATEAAIEVIANNLRSMEAADAVG
jgi:hypothetical protein